MNLEFIRPIVRYVPQVALPKRHVPFKEKLMWTGAVLLLFFVMGSILPIGVHQEDIREEYRILQVVLASKIGTLISVGIGPIVTASIILQLLVGAKMLDIDLTTQDGRALFQTAQKILTIVITFLEVSAVVAGFQLGRTLIEKMGESWSLLHPLVLFIIFQIALGSIFLMYLDEVVSKWGIGSGIGLFIAGGVSQRIISASFNPLTSSGGSYWGAIPRTIDDFMNGKVDFFEIFTSDYLFPVLAVIAVFIVVVYCESMRLEIPLSYGGIRGIGGRYPLKFFYVSNIPVILTWALIENIRIWTRLMGVDITSEPLESYDKLQIIAYYIGRNFTLGELHGILAPDNLYKLADPTIIAHLVLYSLFFIALCILFGKFWVETTGLDARSIAEQIEDAGMQIPGFRRDRRIIEKVLNRYIPPITIISSIAVGLVALVADLTGAYGTGTGILLTVGILYNMYEQIKREQMIEMHPAFRKFMGKL